MITDQAVLYYTSQYFIWWDFGGMTIQELNIGGIDPNCLHPKPRPTTPRDFFESILFQYQKGNWLVISEISEKTVTKVKVWWDDFLLTSYWLILTFYWVLLNFYWLLRSTAFQPYLSCERGWGSFGHNMYFLNNNKNCPKTIFWGTQIGIFWLRRGIGLKILNVSKTSTCVLETLGHRFSNELSRSLLASILSNWKALEKNYRGTTKNAKKTFFCFLQITWDFGIGTHIQGIAMWKLRKMWTSFWVWEFERGLATILSFRNRNEFLISHTVCKITDFTHNVKFYT